MVVAAMIASLPASLLAAFPLAFAAGLVSFVSPCVLPLLPGYLAFLGGSASRGDGRGARGRTLVGSLAFILGFSAIFVSFGALFGQFGDTLKAHQRPLEIVFGLVTIVLGFFFAGWWPSSWLQRERRVHFLPRASVLGAALLGIFFAVGWTPCIGPTLAAIDGLAASSSGATALRGSMLAFVYCLGLGVPFLVAALATEWMSSASSWLRRHARAIGVVGGALLVLIGVAEVTGLWQSWVLWLQIHLPATSSL
ncbi:MAG: cytochrome c biogenesis protein CcdA [Acidobacteriota bacterium]|nr:cytochrome c biogenesis protein CcdA [Acidobacteriota bacterium]MDE3092404.1 cytochrome c biogenesis protein CcdA [Acidobacteriota bacterium]MDE3138614.1 cytochrome c biogenesis protein CcdA [Acidobacteriota bacterium]MDE3146833.1 cytochrome c biogenesis protein CcdA [Acidobacteriota bacterium]